MGLEKRLWNWWPQRSGSKDPAVSGVRGGAERQGKWAHPGLAWVLPVTWHTGVSVQSEAPPHFAAEFRERPVPPGALGIRNQMVGIKNSPGPSLALQLQGLSPEDWLCGGGKEA